MELSARGFEYKNKLTKLVFTDIIMFSQLHKAIAYMLGLIMILFAIIGSALLILGVVLSLETETCAAYGMRQASRRKKSGFVAWTYLGWLPVKPGVTINDGDKVTIRFGQIVKARPRTRVITTMTIIPPSRLGGDRESPHRTYTGAFSPV